MSNLQKKSYVLNCVDLSLVAFMWFVCYSPGGLIALGAESSSNKTYYMGLAADIAHTCHESYDRAGEDWWKLFDWFTLLSTQTT